jgi:hypothetical protein
MISEFWNINFHTFNIVVIVLLQHQIQRYIRSEGTIRVKMVVYT